jgi:hypothetical protein
MKKGYLRVDLSLNNNLCLIIRIRRLRCSLRTVQPLNIPHTSPNIPLFQLHPCQLLLLARAEFHISTFGIRVGGTSTWGSYSAWHSRRDVRAGNTAAGSAILEAVKGDGEVSLLCDAAIGDVPLFRAERTDEFFVMGDHYHTTFEVSDSDSKTTKRITIEEIGTAEVLVINVIGGEDEGKYLRFVKYQYMGIVPHGSRKYDLDFLTSRQPRDLVVIGNLRV